MDSGWGSPALYIGCLQWAIAPTDLTGANPNPLVRPHAIGNSYGCPTSEGCQWDTLHDVVEAVRAAGIVMAVSAGNSGSGCSTIYDPPGLEPSVISVAATGYQSNTVASFSSRGPIPQYNNLKKPEISSPGSSVRSCVRNNGYASYSGTSMASPHINGAVALLVTACPHLAYNVDAIQPIIQQTAVALFSTQGCGGDTATTTPNNVYGYGQLDVHRAVTACIQSRK